MRKRFRNLLLLTLIILSIAIIYFIYWYSLSRHFRYTDAAYIRGHDVIVNSNVTGSVKEIRYETTKFVKEGDPIVLIDNTNYRIAFDTSKANLAKSVREVSNLFQNVITSYFDLLTRESSVFKINTMYNNRKHLVESGAISREEFTNIESALQEAKALLESARSNFRTNVNNIKGRSVRNHPIVSSASELLKKSWLDLKRSVVRAPLSGIVGDSLISVGQMVSPNTPMLSIIPLDDIWVEANFKETNISDIKVGQRAYIYSDVYGRSVKYNGYVIGIGAGTGGTFSPLPTQSISGNWIKIVQRVPIRISIDEIEAYPLILGLSMHVYVDVRKEGMNVIDKRNRRKTNIFEDNFQEVDDIIERVILENSFCDISDISHLLEDQCLEQ